MAWAVTLGVVSAASVVLASAASWSSGLAPPTKAVSAMALLPLASAR
jgi:hypothetical protein